MKCHQQRDGEKADKITLVLEPVAGTGSATLVDGQGATGAISDDTLTMEILGALDDDPGRGVAASIWGATAGVAPSTLHRYRKTLVAAGLVGTLDGTRYTRYVLTDQGREVQGARVP